jgi:hypothetical protein
MKSPIPGLGAFGAPRRDHPRAAYRPNALTTASVRERTWSLS